MRVWRTDRDPTEVGWSGDAWLTCHEGGWASGRPVRRACCSCCQRSIRLCLSMYKVYYSVTVNGV